MYDVIFFYFLINSFTIQIFPQKKKNFGKFFFGGENFFKKNFLGGKFYSTRTLLIQFSRNLHRKLDFSTVHVPNFTSQETTKIPLRFPGYVPLYTTDNSLYLFIIC